MSHCDPRLIDAIAAALRPLLTVADAQWREQYRLARALPDHWRGPGASEAVEALFASLDGAEATVTRIRDAVDTLDAAAQVLRAIGARLEAAVAGLPDDPALPDAGSPGDAVPDEAGLPSETALRAAAARAVAEVGVVVDSVLDPCVAEPEGPQPDPAENPVAADSPPTAEPAPERSILVDPMVAQSNSDTPVEPPPVDPGVVERLAVEPALLHGNSARRAPSSSHPRAELAAVGPDDDASAPILAEAGSW